MSSDGRPALVVGVLKELGEGRWWGAALEQGQQREEGAGNTEDMPVRWGKRAPISSALQKKKKKKRTRACLHCEHASKIDKETWKGLKISFFIF
jgi:hypothetical protein